MLLVARRSSDATAPIQNEVELGEKDRSEIDDRKRRPSSAPAGKPRDTGSTPLPPSTRSPNDLMSSGSRRPGSGSHMSGVKSFAQRWLRLLAVRKAPKISTDSCGVKPNVRPPCSRVFVSCSIKNSVERKNWP